MITPKLGLKVSVTERPALVGIIADIVSPEVVKVKMESQPELVTVAVHRLQVA